MLDLNNYVATSVSWPQLYYVKPGLKPAKNAKQIYFPNRTWGPFLESPENFSGPKSHLWNCQPLILEGRSFNMFSS